MRELRDIIAAFERCCEASEPAVLASVVHVEGSTYRRRGARLLVVGTDTMVGLISGGCLEGDLLEHALSVRESGTPALIHYDASQEDDLVWGLGLGCAGVVDVWLERVDAEAPGPLAWIRSWMARRTSAAMATAIAGRDLGRRAARTAEGDRIGDLALPVLDDVLQRALARGAGETLHDDGSRIAVEIFRPPTRVALFGAGPDAAPLAALLDGLGWDVAVFDHRPAVAQDARFPGARVTCTPVANAVASADIDCETACVVMNHHYLHDRDILGALRDSAAPYVAVLGPRERTDNLLSDLAGVGAGWSEEDMQRLFAPAGLDIGADAPEAIALSIAAEIQAVFAGRTGGPLRERKAPIHDPEVG